MRSLPSIVGGEYNPYHLNERGPLVRFDFDEETHTYKVDGSIIVPSVSEIIATVFGNKFAKVNPEVLARAAKKGSLIHKQILDTIISGKTEGFSKDYIAAIEWLKIYNSSYPDVVAPEQRLFCRNDVMEFGCTIDNFWLGRAKLVDYKTGSRLDVANVTRQLNLYAYALRKIGYEVKSLEAWHLHNGVCTPKPIPLFGDSYCESILKAYRYGYRFKNDKEMLDFFESWDGDFPQQKKDEVKAVPELDELLDKIHKIDDVLEKLEKAREDCVSRVFSFMTTSKMLEHERPDMKAVLVQESERKSLNTKLFKEEKPRLYDCLLRDFPKISKVSAHVRISYKKEKENAD